MTLKELLRVIEEIKKDLAYTQRLEQRWVSEEKRFPLIYKYIIKQREAFENQVDKTMTAQIDISNLDEYVKNRLGIKGEKLKTEQVSPPKEEPAEKPAPKPPMIEKPAPAAKMPEPPRIEKPEPAPAPKPSPAAEDKAKTARKALEEAAAAAALKLRDDMSEMATQPVTGPPPKKTMETPEKAPTQTGAAEAEAQKPSSRDKLRRLASEVLDEVKKSRTD